MTRRLYVARLAADHFRNHGALDLSLDDRPVCIVGQNGAGKTNILEALTVLAPGRGLRGAGLADLAQRGAARDAPEGTPEGARHWAVSARVMLDGETHTLGAGAERTPEESLRRIARLDGRPAAAGDLARIARIVWLTPAMDRLFAGPAGDRRRFLDRLVLGRASEHGLAAAAYERALRERQRLLAEEGRDHAWLSALERELAAHGAAIAAARLETVSLLAAAIAQRPESAFPRAEIAIEGVLEARFAEGAKSADVEEEFAERLRASRARDAAAGRALEGPHRSDLKVRHAGKDMPADLCSTGEQKALLIGLILAHAAALATDAGPALVLIDEAAAHLDEARRAALFEEVLAGAGQAWLTGTDAMLFEAFAGRAQRVVVEEGVAHVEA